MPIGLIIISALTILLHKVVHDLILNYSTSKVDWIHEEEDLQGSRLSEKLRAIDNKYFNRYLPTLIIMLLLCLFPGFRVWQVFEASFAGLFLIVSIVCFLAWKYILTDIDPFSNQTLFLHRFVILICSIGIYFSPVFLIPFLYLAINYFKGWLHHNQLPIRILQMTVSFVLASEIYRIASTYFEKLSIIDGRQMIALFFTLIIAVYAMHYWVPAAKKVLMTKQGKFWPVHNELHFIVAGAYTWGWMRFWKEKRVVSLIQGLKKWNIPFQFGAIIIEASCLLIFFLPQYYFLIFGGIIGLHILIFMCSGILFWEYILTNILLAVSIHLAISDQVLFLGTSFSIFYLIFTLSLPLLGIAILRPKALGWWDAPLAGRFHWEVIGESGTRYELYNDQFGPHERVFGRVYGRFLSNEKVMYNHLGEVNSYNLKVLIKETNGKTDQIQDVKERHGIDYIDENFTYLHDSFMKKLINNYNSKATKNVLPSYLKILKPFGGQYYYWGDLPRYDTKEKIVKLQVRFLEYFFDGNGFVETKNEIVKELNFK